MIYLLIIVSYVQAQKFVERKHSLPATGPVESGLEAGSDYIDNAILHPKHQPYEIIATSVPRVYGSNKESVGKQSDYNQNEGDVKLDGRRGVHLEFLVAIRSRTSLTESHCTGTLVHSDWVITAHHCIVDDDEVAGGDEDKIIENPEMIVEHPTIGDRKGMERKVLKVILDSKFKGEALSWQGSDFALLQLAPLEKNSLKRKLACLPAKNSKLNTGDRLYIAGYGRRNLPHCLTDDKGPEKFESCASGKACSKEHHAEECGLKFLYQNKMHTECIKGPTPSANGSLCGKLLEKENEIKNTMYILNKNKDKIEATCYPSSTPKDSKGWCTTRSPGVEEDREPSWDAGWGFCSSAEDQEYCNTHIPPKEDLRAFEVSKLSLEHCMTEVMNNLAVEQPHVTRDQVEPLPGQFCLGVNKTLDLSSHKFYQSVEGDLKPLEANKAMQQLVESTGRHRAIDGGPACFGDSGGPAFQIKDEDGKHVSVLVGVFSYMLWGTCRGRHEPSYYGKVLEFLPWIHKYIPKEDVCTS